MRGICLAKSRLASQGLCSMDLVIRCRITASFIHSQLWAAVAGSVRHSTVRTGTRGRTLEPPLKSRWMSGLDYRAHTRNCFPKRGRNIEVLLPKYTYKELKNFLILVQIVFTQYVWISVITLSDSYRLSLSLGCMKAKLLPHAVPAGQSLDFCVTYKILITSLNETYLRKKNHSVAAPELFIQQSASHAGWMRLLLHSVYYCANSGEDKGKWSASNVRSNFRASGGKFRWIPTVSLHANGVSSSV
jgi:hypothetical protein